MAIGHRVAAHIKSSTSILAWNLFWRNIFQIEPWQVTNLWMTFTLSKCPMWNWHIGWVCLYCNCLAVLGWWVWMKLSFSIWISIHWINELHHLHALSSKYYCFSCKYVRINSLKIYMLVKISLEGKYVNNLILCINNIEL